MKPEGDPHYVRVEWWQDGKKCRGDFHPTSITVCS
jgi:hypothetical protein